MLCPTCKHTLLPKGTIELTEAEPAQQYDTQCKVCGAIFRITIALLRPSEQPPEKLAERRAQQQKPFERAK